MRLHAVGEDGTRRAYLGFVVTPQETPDAELQKKLMDTLWDPRLDAASCRPEFETVEELDVRDGDERVEDP